LLGENQPDLQALIDHNRTRAHAQRARYELDHAVAAERSAAATVSTCEQEEQRAKEALKRADLQHAQALAALRRWGITGAVAVIILLVILIAARLHWPWLPLWALPWPLVALGAYVVRGHVRRDQTVRGAGAGLETTRSAVDQAERALEHARSAVATALEVRNQAMYASRVLFQFSRPRLTGDTAMTQ
jgi:hypothetical protein